MLAPVTGSPPLFTVTILPVIVELADAGVRDSADEDGPTGPAAPPHACIASTDANRIAIRMTNGPPLVRTPAPAK
jgi:hypothetical protein